MNMIAFLFWVENVLPVVYLGNMKGLGMLTGSIQTMVSVLAQSCQVPEAEWYPKSQTPRERASSREQEGEFMHMTV